MILLYEDIVRDGVEGCKRHKLVGKKYFGGLYEGSERNEDLWLEVQQYIYDNYDTAVSYTHLTLPTTSRV